MAIFFWTHFISVHYLHEVDDLEGKIPWNRVGDTYILTELELLSLHLQSKNMIFIPYFGPSNPEISFLLSGGLCQTKTANISIYFLGLEG